MDLFEYQAKELFAKHSVPTTPGRVTDTPEGAKAIAEEIGKPVMVKAQVKTGGRGKAGGVKYAATPEDAYTHAQNILGLDIKGHIVKRLLVSEASDIAEEYYISFLLDRANRTYLAMCSVEGGMEIEEVAAKDPDAIYKEYIDPAVGFQPYQARNLAFRLGLKPTQINEAVKFMTGLYKVYIETDASLLEINPFITTKDDKLLALDCKINFDDNAMFRHKELKDLRDVAEEDPLEVEASKYALNYIKLDGNIACMVNGAGLAMATMDIIQYAGGSPANFLDVGGGANQQQIEQAFGILLSDRNVKAIFINIFGGILRVDVLAQGVVAAAKNLGVKIPIVLRLEGTNVEEGRKILKESGLNFEVGSTMKDAADLVVNAAKGVTR
jgi:succinyl-CoA synthetase beta subunit